MVDAESERPLCRKNLYYEMLGSESASKEIMQKISDYMGDAFEGICTEFFRKAKGGASVQISVINNPNCVFENIGILL